jgi:hypothetical protein
VYVKDRVRASIYTLVTREILGAENVAWPKLSEKLGRSLARILILKL